MGDSESDYDLVWVLTETEYARREAAGEDLDETVYEGGLKLIERSWTTLTRLRSPHVPEWVIRGFQPATVLFDRDGSVHRTLHELLSLSPERSREEAATNFDGYLNCFYRSLKAYRRKNELGARLQASESLTYLTRALFALEGRLPPFHDRLTGTLDTLSGHHWHPRELEQGFLAVARTGTPPEQIVLQERVVSLMRSRDLGSVVDDWGGEIERVAALFPEEE
jgi:hypothetical protein